MQDVLSLTSVVLLAGVPLTIVPEPTQAQCHDIDREVSQLIAELDHGLSSVATALQAYSLALNPTIKLPHDEPTTWLGTVSATVFEYPFFWYPLHYYRTGCWTYCEGKWGGDLDSTECNYDDFCLKMRKLLHIITNIQLSLSDAYCTKRWWVIQLQSFIGIAVRGSRFRKISEEKRRPALYAEKGSGHGAYSKILCFGTL